MSITVNWNAPVITPERRAELVEELRRLSADSVVTINRDANIRHINGQPAKVDESGNYYVEAEVTTGQYQHPTCDKPWHEQPCACAKGWLR